ncbi:ThuA domain-containing protein [Algoriphagus namhaensis]|uniref:ThuA domain-containing protein n=1 Tax=Algoriphagus namhaensis TaxID=915353 RepID=A0ABV8AP12_9BACT
MFKILGLIVGVLLLLIVLGGGLFVYKVKNGFPVSYETDPADISIPQEGIKVLLFSKTTGFRHGESIQAAKEVFGRISTEKGWFLYNTESAGVFNSEQLNQFNVVIFNNSTGRVLTDEQRLVLQEYVENGGKLIGIHGAGDDSHHWDWYETHLLGAKFSHHPLNPQLQEAQVSLQPGIDSVLSRDLAKEWVHTDEWYVFFEDPASRGFQILYSIDGDKILPSGNLLFIKSKEFGMGKNHPVAWFKKTGKGKTFYTSMGHNATAWGEEAFIQMLINAIEW